MPQETWGQLVRHQPRRLHVVEGLPPPPAADDDGIGQLASNPIIDAVLRLYGGALVVVDGRRRIVARNTAYLDLLGVERPAEVIGLRLGEAAGCVHAHEGPAGCGTTVACRSCGAAIAMSLSLEGSEAAEATCAVQVRGGPGTVDLVLSVRTLPLDGPSPRVLVLLSDVGPDRRRAALERAVTHELANLSAALSSAGEELGGDLPIRLRGAAEDVRIIAARLAGEVEVHRAIAAAPAGSGRLAVPPVPVRDVLHELRDHVRARRVCAGRHIAIEPPDPGSTVATDRSLLEHVLGQAVANALEATPEGGEVRIGASAERGAVTFRVWNAGAIAAPILPRIFQRYFTTKGDPARGHGTYLMKLLGERALGGEVGFSSSPEAGTTFTVRLPQPVAPPLTIVTAPV